MAAVRTNVPADVAERFAGLSAARQSETTALIEIFRDASGFEPVLWGKIIGFGRYAYTYKSGRSGESFATGFSPTSTKYSLHIMPGYAPFEEIAARLGPHTRGKSCWYIKRLDGVATDALRDLIKAGLNDLGAQWPISPT